MVCSAHAAPMRNCNHHLSSYVLHPSTWCKWACKDCNFRTQVGGWHYPTYFSPNIVAISIFNYSCYKLHICRYVCWYTSFLRLLPSRSMFKTKPQEIHWNHHVFGHESRKISVTVITLLPAPCYVFVSNLNFLPISYNRRCSYTSFITQTYIGIYIPCSWIFCMQAVYVCSNQISIMHCGGSMFAVMIRAKYQ